MTDTKQSDEPIGIVISRGSRTEAEPRLSAYIWGQVEEGPGNGKGSKAA